MFKSMIGFLSGYVSGLGLGARTWEDLIEFGTVLCNPAML